MENITRRSLLIGLAAAPFCASWALTSGTQSSLMFVGTYTNKGSSKGIYAYRWQADSGTLQPLGLAAAAANPTFLALSLDRRRLYAANEIDEYQGARTGSVSAFSIAGTDGKLALRNVVSSGGSGPAHVMVDHTGKVVIASNYGGGSLASFRVLSDGALSDMVSHFHFNGHGEDPVRQTSSHIHSAIASSDDRFVLVNDLGLDRIHVFKLDAGGGSLTANVPPFYQAQSKAGPRNAVFHPNGRWVYSVNEMASSVDALEWDGEKGILQRFQNVSTLPPGYTSQSTASAVGIDTAGRFLYSANRGANTLVVFAIDAAKGTLTQIQQISSGGKTPRQFALDPSGRWLLAGNQDSATIVVFARSPASGRLTATAKQYALDSPVCFVFA
jgi:6-phosphogluconolactonase